MVYLPTNYIRGSILTIKHELLLNYYEEIAIPTIDEFFQAKTDIRRAKLAMICLYHVVDYLKEAKELRISNMLSECSDLKSLSDAANVTKHSVLTKYQPTIKRVDQIKQKNHAGLFTSPFGEGYFGEANEVYISFNDGLDLEVKRVSNILINVKNYFDKIIYK
jgi:hypothetical protein